MLAIYVTVIAKIAFRKLSIFLLRSFQEGYPARRICSIRFHSVGYMVLYKTENVFYLVYVLHTDSSN